MPATYEPIATQTLGTAATITFSSIPATYTDLRLVLTGLTSSGFLYLRFNADAGTNYSQTSLIGNGASASSNAFTAQGYINFQAGTAESTTIPSFTDINIFSYAGSTNKTTLINQSNDDNGAGVQLGKVVTVALWRSTAAITSISIPRTMAIGTTATLYGIKNA